MDNWSYPVSKYYNVTLKGISGLTAATIRYGVTYQHSGRYGGKGKYLTGVRVSVKKVNLDWGYDLDAKSELVNISNVGQNGVIVAGATLEIQYTLKHILKTKMNSMQIFVTGDNKVKIN